MHPDENADVYPLDEDSIALLAEIERDAAKLEGRAVGILSSFLRRQKLQGDWRVAPNQREIYRLGPKAPANKGE